MAKVTPPNNFFVNIPGPPRKNSAKQKELAINLKTLRGDKILEKHGMHLFEFPSSLWNTLTRDDKIVLPYLIGVAKTYGELYLEQMKEAGGVDNFPITADMIARSKDPRIYNKPDREKNISTCVTGSNNSQILDIPYCIAYQEKLEKIANLFVRAANQVGDRATEKLLLAQADAALFNRWAPRDEKWLETLTCAKKDERLPFGGSRLVYFCGPYESKARGQKGAFEMLIGIIDPKYDALLANIQQTIFPCPTNSPRDIVHLYCVHSPIVSGESFEHTKTGKMLPNYGDIKAHWGSVDIINLTTNQYIFTRQTPMLAVIFRDATMLSAEDRARRVIVHEMGHSAVIMSNAEIVQQKESLQNDRTRYFDALIELDGTVAWLRHLERAKQIFNSDDRRRIYTSMAAEWVDRLLLYLEGKESNWMYCLGNTSLFKLFFDNGAISVENGRIIFHLATEDKLNQLEQILARFAEEEYEILMNGGYEAADKLFGNNKDFLLYAPILKNVFDLEQYRSKALQIQRKFDQLVA